MSHLTATQSLVFVSNSIRVLCGCEHNAFLISAQTGLTPTDKSKSWCVLIGCRPHPPLCLLMGVVVFTLLCFSAMQRTQFPLKLQSELFRQAWFGSFGGGVVSGVELLVSYDSSAYRNTSALPQHMESSFTNKRRTLLIISQEGNDAENNWVLYYGACFQWTAALRGQLYFNFSCFCCDNKTNRYSWVSATLVLFISSWISVIVSCL